MPDFRETIIRIDHGSKTVNVWTQDPAILRKLDRAGASRDGQHQLSQEWRILSLDRFKWRILQDRGARQRTPAQIEATRRLQEARKEVK